MRMYVRYQEALIALRPEEPAYESAADDPAEFFRELFLGRPDESATERAGRLDAAGGILADLECDAPELARYAAAMLNAYPLVRRAIVPRAAFVGAAA